MLKSTHLTDSSRNLDRSIQLLSEIRGSFRHSASSSIAPNNSPHLTGNMQTLRQLDALSNSLKAARNSQRAAAASPASNVASSMSVVSSGLSTVAVAAGAVSMSFGLASAAAQTYADVVSSTGKLASPQAWRTLELSFALLGAEIGQYFLPIILELAGDAQALARHLSGLSDETKNANAAFASLLAPYRALKDVIAPNRTGSAGEGGGESQPGAWESVFGTGFWHSMKRLGQYGLIYGSEAMGPRADPTGITQGVQEFGQNWLARDRHNEAVAAAAGKTPGSGHESLKPEQPVVGSLKMNDPHWTQVDRVWDEAMLKLLGGSEPLQMQLMKTQTDTLIKMLELMKGPGEQTPLQEAAEATFN